MRWGLGISLFVHTAILLAAVVVLPSPDEYEVDNMEAIPIDIVDIEEESKRMAQAPDAPEDVKEPANKPVEKPVTVAPPSKPMPPQQQAVMPPPAAEEENKAKDQKEEKEVTEKGFANPKFVEDIVRDIAHRLKQDPNIVWFSVSAENFESIHNHSAYAQITGGER